MVPSLMQGQVDAILGSMDAYQIQLEQLGAELDNYPFASHGVPTVSTSIFASNDFIAKNPDVLRRFVAASLKGWVFALDNPEKTIQHVKATFPEVNVTLAAAELKAIRPLFCSGDAKFIGKAEDSHGPARRSSSRGQAPAEGQDPKTYYTNEFLPPESEMRACSR